MHFRLLRTALVSAMVALAGTGAAWAADSQVSRDAPDLTAVRAMIKAKSFAAARDERLRLADSHHHAYVFNLLGFSLRKLGDYRTSHTYYKKALDFDPEHKSALEYLGELYVETGQPDKARETLALLRKLCPAGCEEREDLEKAMREAGIALEPS